MSICPIDRGQCDCQPDEGVACSATEDKSVIARLAYEAGEFNARSICEAKYLRAKARIAEVELELSSPQPASQPQEAVQEPFGYFRATASGWEDCAETDPGAIPLYEVADEAALRQMRRAADALESMRASDVANCENCANRGRVNGLSQETFCDSCVWYGQTFKRDNYVALAAAPQEPKP